MASCVSHSWCLCIFIGPSLTSGWGSWYHITRRHTHTHLQISLCLYGQVFMWHVLVCTHSILCVCVWKLCCLTAFLCNLRGKNPQFERRPPQLRHKGTWEESAQLYLELSFSTSHVWTCLYKLFIMILTHISRSAFSFRWWLLNNINFWLSKKRNKRYVTLPLVQQREILPDSRL